MQQNFNIEECMVCSDFTGETFVIDNLSFHLIENLKKHKDNDFIYFIFYNYDCYVDDKYLVHVIINNNTQFEVIYAKNKDKSCVDYNKSIDKKEIFNFLKTDMGIKKFNPPVMDTEEIFKNINLICQQELSALCDKQNNKKNNIKKLLFCKLNNYDIEVEYVKMDILLQLNNKKNILPKRRDRDC